MPTPGDNESRSDFISRCTPQLIEEGKDRDQAVAICHSLWSNKSRFMTWKSASGQYQWFAMWSNKYRDRDYPPEILSEAAHIDFVSAVKSGSWPYPELWLWHIPGTAWGDATYIDYDKANGITIAGGTVRPGLEAVAEALTSTSVPIKVSHGMSRKEIRRDDEDPTVLTRYRSKEISPLPDYAAANELTGFTIGGNMKILESAKARLTAVFGEKKADEIAELLDVTGTEAKDLDLESKEADEKVVETPVEEKAADEVPEPEKEVEPTPEPTPEPDLDMVDRKEMETVVTRLSELIGDTNATIKSVADTLSALDQRIANLEQSDEEKIADKAQSTPRASLMDIINSRTIGKEQTRVDGRTALGKDGPEQTKEDNLLVRTGHPRMDSVVTSIINDPPALSQGGS